MPSGCPRTWQLRHTGSGPLIVLLGQDRADQVNRRAQEDGPGNAQVGVCQGRRMPSGTRRPGWHGSDQLGPLIGEVDCVRLLEPATLDQARTPHPDQLPTHFPLPFGLGYEAGQWRRRQPSRHLFHTVVASASPDAMRTNWSYARRASRIRLRGAAC